MKNKFFLLSTIISSCLTIVCSQSTADEYMQSGGRRSCYPASKCTGDPNLIGGGRGYGYAGPNNESGDSSKILQTESTEKFEGTIKSVNRVALPNQSQIQITLSTEQGDLLVIVGPANFVDQAKVKVQAGDKITVTGYRIKANGNQVIVAAEIKKNGYTLQLLDENRQPVWEQQDESGMQSRMQYSGSQNPKMPNSRY